MSGALNALREGVAEQLRQAGVNAVTAMESGMACRWREAVAAVSLSRVVCTSGGFQDYLGVQTDPETGNEWEVYGREAELTLAVDVFAPRDGGARMCQSAAEVVSECLVCRGAAGLGVLELLVGETAFLEQEGMYRLPVSCRCKAWLVAAVDGGGDFVDFEVKGRLK